MRKIYSALLALSISFSAFSQDNEKVMKKNVDDLKAKPTGADSSGWHTGFAGTLNFTQVALSNWSAGGQNSISLLGVVNTFAKYKKDKYAWDNFFTGSYGFVQSIGQPMQKSDDRIDLLSKFGYQANEKLYYTVLANFKSQFSATFQDDSILVSHFAAPAFALVALGLDWKPKPYLSVFLSPATGRYIIVANQELADAGAFGVKPAEYGTQIENGLPVIVKTKNGEQLRSEFGAYFLAIFQKDIVKNINLTSKLELFNNYTDDIKRNRANIDVNWETNIGFKVNKFFSASFIFHLIYDENVPITYGLSDGTTKTGPIAQIRQVLGLGLTYQVSNRK